MLWSSFRQCSSRSIRICPPWQPKRSLILSACRNSPISRPRFSRLSHSTPAEAPQPAPIPGFTEKVGRPQIQNHILFVLLTTGLAFTFAASKTNEETINWTRKLTSMSHVWVIQPITSVDLRRIQNAEVIQRLRQRYTQIIGKIQEVPGIIRPWVGLTFVTVMQPYADASEGKRLCWKICLLNAGVWAAWKISRIRRPMSIGFMHHPLSGLSFTLFTSMFSHRSFIHLLFNCLALESFGSAAYYYLIKEQSTIAPEQLESTTAWHFLAFFISAGLFSGLVSHVVAAKFQYPRLIAQLASPANAVKKTDTWAAAVAASATAAKSPAPKKIVSEILPSLGASGAVYAAVTMSALAFPESQVALFIPPSYPISIQYGVGGFLLLDVIGALRGWRVMDHWAHLGGAAFGAMYYAYGPRFWSYLRGPMDLKTVREITDM